MFWGFVCLFGWLVVFLLQKKYTWKRFCVWSNFAPSPADFFRSPQADESAEGHSWLIKMPLVTRIDFRLLLALSLFVLCPCLDPFCQVTMDLYLGKTFLKCGMFVLAPCNCSMDRCNCSMDRCLLLTLVHSFVHRLTHTSSLGFASPQVFLGRALSKKLLALCVEGRHCVNKENSQFFSLI